MFTFTDIPHRSLMVCRYFAHKSNDEYSKKIYIYFRRKKNHTQIHKFWGSRWTRHKCQNTGCIQIWIDSDTLALYPSVLDFWKIKFEKSILKNWIFNLQKSISKFIFPGYTGSKNPVLNRLKIQFVKLDFSNRGLSWP